MTHTLIKDKETRDHAALAVGALVLVMRAEGLTIRAMSAALPQRAQAECPEAWALLRGTLARDKPLGNQRTVALMRRALAHSVALSQEPTEHARSALDEQSALLWRKLLGSEAFKRGDPKAIDAGRRLLSDRAKLHGLNVEKAQGELAPLLAALAAARTANEARSAAWSQSAPTIEDARAAHPFAVGTISAQPIDLAPDGELYRAKSSKGE